MQRLSSNFTLFFKIFLPTAWASFFGLFGVVILILNQQDEPFLTSSIFRIIYWISFVLFGLLIYFTLIQLKRVEHQGDFLFVTNYFKTVKFPVDNIKEIAISDLFLFKVGTIKLHQKGRFGNKIKFLIKKATFQGFHDRYAHLIKE